MSFNELLDELQTLTAAERQLVMRRALEIDDSPLSTAEELLVDQRLRDHKENAQAAITLGEMNSRLRSRFGQ